MPGQGISAPPAPDRPPRTHATRLAAELHRLGWRYHRFLIEYTAAARVHLGESRTVTERQFKNWVAGRVKTSPQPGAAKVLEALFPPYTVRELLTPPTDRPSPPGARPEPPTTRAQPEAPPADPGESIDQDAADAVRFARDAAATNCHPLVLDQLDADIDQLARGYVARPLGELVQGLRAARVAVFELLAGRQYPRQTVRLHLAAARVCGLACYAALDAGRYRAAADLGRTAELSAQLSGDPELLAWVRSAQALIAYWEGRNAEAANLAASGRDVLAQRPPSAAVVRLAALEARAHARHGDASRALAALAAAHDARQACGEHTVDAGMFDFPAAKQDAYASTTLLALGGTKNLRQATVLATRSATRYLAAPPAAQSTGDLLAAHLDLATARLRLGEVDGTADAMAYVFAVPAHRHSASIRQRIADLASALDTPAQRRTRAARELREQLATLPGGHGTMDRNRSQPDGSHPR